MKQLPLYLLAAVSGYFCLTFKTNLFITTLIIFGLPSVYLTNHLNNKQIIPRLLLAAFLGSTMLSLLVDYLGFLNHAWFVIDTIFPFRIFNAVPVEDLIWAFLWIYLILIFYEIHFKTGNKSLLGKRFMYWFLVNGVAFAAFFAALFLNPALLQIPYYYLVSGVILALIPTILFFKSYPKYVSRFAKVASYIAVVSFVDEMVALKLGGWTFYGGKFLLVFRISGVELPFEELFFYILIGSVFVLSYYEFLDGDTT